MGMIAEPQSPWLIGLLTGDHNIMPSTLGRNRADGNVIPRGAMMFTTVCPDRSVDARGKCTACIRAGAGR